MGMFHLTELQSTSTFLLEQCQHSKNIGGFSKLPDTYPDLIHSFYSIAWLSIAGNYIQNTPDDNDSEYDLKRIVQSGELHLKMVNPMLANCLYL